MLSETPSRGIAGHSGRTSARLADYSECCPASMGYSSSPSDQPHHLGTLPFRLSAPRAQNPGSRQASQPKYI
jgi:hypothetical protein